MDRQGERVKQAIFRVSISDSTKISVELGNDATNLARRVTLYLEHNSSTFLSSAEFSAFV